MSKETQTLESFTGFAAANHDFFGEVSSAGESTVDTVIDEVINDDIVVGKDKPADTPETPKPTPAETHDFGFGDAPEEEEEEIEIEEEEIQTDANKGKSAKNKNVSSSSLSTLDFLKSKGFIEYELPEGKTELSEIEAENLLEDSWEKSLDDAIAETVEGLDPIAQQILKTAHNGGDVNKLIKDLAKVNTTGINKDTDMTVEANQVLAVTLNLEKQGYDAEDIEAHIEALKSTNKLETIAQKEANKVIAEQAKLGEEQSKQAKMLSDARKLKQREYKDNLHSFLSETKEINGVTLNKKDAVTFASYIADPTVTLQNGEVVTEMQRDLFAAMADKETLFLFSKMLKGKKGKLDLSFIENKAITKQTREIEKNITNTDKNPITRSSSGSSRKGRSLADHF